MQKIKTNQKGLALVEVLFGIAIIMLASIIFAGVIQNTFQASKNSRDFLIAQNLGEEGSEVLEIIIHSNELLLEEFNDDQQNRCWDLLRPELLEFEICDGNTDEIEPGSYVPWFNLEEGRWRLYEVNIPLDLDQRVADGQDIGVLAPFLIHENQGPTIPLVYLHNRPELEGYPAATFDATPTKFYRSIEVSAVDQLSITAEVKVQWIGNNGRVFTISQPFFINNPFN